MSFDEQPDGDIHGERAAEIHRLEQELTIERGRSFVLCLKLMEKSSEKVQLTNQLDACRPYLKDGETAADALERLSRLVNAVDCTDFYGIKCENIDGKNWFDVRGKTKETT